MALFLQKQCPVRIDAAVERAICFARVDWLESQAIAHPGEQAHARNTAATRVNSSKSSLISGGFVRSWEATAWPLHLRALDNKRRLAPTKAQTATD